MVYGMEYHPVVGPELVQKHSSVAGRPRKPDRFRVGIS